MFTGVAPALREQIGELRDRGYVVVPRFVPPAELAVLNETARVELDQRAAPLELEADLRYPGAPVSRAEAGGETVRRLLDAYGRHAAFARRGASPEIAAWMQGYFDEPVSMSRAHHNCLMTKHPRYGSLTHWHRDARYWSFQRDDLVSVWYALGEERVDNGALWFVPASHRMHFDAGRFDDAKFFRDDRPDNAEVLRGAESPVLEAGDAVFFHCRTLHSAGQNRSDAVKFSLVYTYHARGNSPLPGSRSASQPEVDLG
jgi:phytanoyl-CoA hydroxylase